VTWLLPDFRLPVVRFLGFFWHRDCSMDSMAKKMNSLQVVEAARAEVEVAKRRHTAPLAALSLMQQRPQSQKIFPARRRLLVTIDGETNGQIPQSVKITHAG
jgi:hypothetical protein